MILKRILLSFCIMFMIPKHALALSNNEIKIEINNYIELFNKDTVVNKTFDFINANRQYDKKILEIIKKDYPYLYDEIIGFNYRNSVNNLQNQSKSNTNIGAIIGGAGGVALIIGALSGGKDSNDGNTTPPDKAPINEENYFSDPPNNNIFYDSQEYKATDGLSMIGAHEIYLNENLTGQGVLVSVIDSGLDPNHPDLIDNINVEKSYSYARDNNDTRDKNGHGTHVAGIIAAMKNETGMHGVSYNAELMGIQAIVDIDEYGNWGYEEGYDIVTDDEIADGIIRSINEGAFVINNSWAKCKTIPDSNECNGISVITDFKDREELESDFTSGFLNAFNELAKSETVAVFSAGNAGISEVGTMAGLPLLIPELSGHIVAVGSVDSNMNISNFSNRCGVSKNWCLVAPGERIWSTWSQDSYILVGDNYSHNTGTSMSAPYVTGSIALLKEKFPSLSHEGILEILFDTAIDLGETGVDYIYGHGMLSLGDAVKPQGDMMIQMSNTTNGKKEKFTQTSIISPIATLSIDDEKIMVTDKYNRAFYTDLSNFIVNQRTNRNKNIVSKMLGKKEDVLIQDDGFIFSVEQNKEEITSNISLGDEKHSLILASANPEWDVFQSSLFQEEKVFLSYNISPIDDIILGIDYTKGKTGFYNDNSVQMVNLKIGTNVNDIFDVDFSYGLVDEKNSVMGISGYGAFTSLGMNNNIEIMGFDSEINFQNNYSLNLSAKYGKSKASYVNSLINSVDYRVKSYEIGIQKSGLLFDKDKIVLSAAKPLVIRGNMNVTVPSGRKPSVGGQISTEVVTQTKNINISNQKDFDVKLGYEARINNNQKISLGVSVSEWSDSYQTGYAEFNWNKNF